MDKEFYKLAVLDPRLQTYRDTKPCHATAADARAAADAMPVGRYRISHVVGSKRTDMEPFEAGTNSAPANAPRANVAKRLASRPMGGRPH